MVLEFLLVFGFCVRFSVGFRPCLESVFLLRVSDLEPGTMDSVRAGPFLPAFSPNNFVIACRASSCVTPCPPGTGQTSKTHPPRIRTDCFRYPIRLNEAKTKSSVAILTQAILVNDREIVS